MLKKRLIRRLMKKIVINGGHVLDGHVFVSGSKNAALPMLISAIAIEGESEISGVPRIGDVEVALELLSEYGVRTEWHGDTLKINTDGAHFTVPSPDPVSKIRASTYLIGASLARFGEARILKYGGCDFSRRPIDLHIEAAVSLGAVFSGDALCAARLSGGEINFRTPSVGATVNALIMAASCEGESVIRGFAREPHILSLIDFLSSAGACIMLTDTEIHVVGGHLKNGRGRVGSDMIEAGSYIAAAAISGGDVTVDGVPCEELCPCFSALEELGVDFLIDRGSVRVAGIKHPGKTKIVAAPYPRFPTDLQPIIAPLMSCALGGEIVDTVWESRFGYLDTLASFGLRYDRTARGAKIYPSEIHRATVRAPDLRGGMACVLLALSAPGESVIYSADTLLRGYENIEKKLRGIGADISVLN